MSSLMLSSGFVSLFFLIFFSYSAHSQTNSSSTFENSTTLVTGLANLSSNSPTVISLLLNQSNSSLLYIIGGLANSTNLGDVGIFTSDSDGAQLVAPIYEPGSEVSNYSVVAGQISLDPQVSQQILSNPSGYSVGITGPNSTSLSQPLTANVTGFLGLPSNLSINPTSEIQALYSIFGGNYASQTQVTPIFGTGRTGEQNSNSVPTLNPNLRAPPSFPPVPAQYPAPSEGSTSDLSLIVTLLARILGSGSSSSNRNRSGSSSDLTSLEEALITSLVQYFGGSSNSGSTSSVDVYQLLQLLIVALVGGNSEDSGLNSNELLTVLTQFL